MSDDAFDETAARARCDAATPGPWESPWSDQEDDPEDDPRAFLGPDGAIIIEVGWHDGALLLVLEADAEFIAHARTDLPAALDEIERLRFHCSGYAGPPAIDALMAERDRLRDVIAALAEDDDDELDLRFLAHLCRHEDRPELAELGWPEMTTVLDRVEAKYGPWQWEGTTAPEVKAG